MVGVQAGSMYGPPSMKHAPQDMAEQRKARPTPLHTAVLEDPTTTDIREEFGKKSPVKDRRNGIGLHKPGDKPYEVSDRSPEFFSTKKAESLEFQRFMKSLPPIKPQPHKPHSQMLYERETARDRDIVRCLDIGGDPDSDDEAGGGPLEEQPSGVPEL
mmetsp:Transcript_4933/g.5778  ORF Transcript_4933/g.5778 Transcript_4933/m.5778 type:complete len:158 (-) Transcript_4933:336-809(-)|eukprot:CAMPEP_0197844606 /NCGR_PEP_ID=MMETSP1438-20131217/1609_1 /TAXON_ID=1461541 /ORGANISM="Pterosperma sp., Strain CCMP1384" /LENGTH=157 /DNA_ID=CAMNT_0043455507 /DNA_START=176 /DNA_END=649 /DNA_ORIENTATION=+